MISPVSILGLLLLSTLAQDADAGAPADAQEPAIQIDRREPTAERILFDPKNPPHDMPKLDPGEAALCQMNFNCEVRVKYEVLEQDRSGAGATAAARVRRIHMTLTLHNKIYIPRGGSAKIRAHEEGHRIINERAFEDAERVARAAAMDVLTQTWRGTGADATAAAKAATDVAVKRLCDEYLAGTADKATRIGQIYDELTSHGRNTKLTEADAIRQATARHAAEQREKAAATAK